MGNRRLITGVSASVSLSPQRLRSLASLVNLAKQYESFEDFKANYLIKMYYGRYWHLTDNPDFQVKKISPTDYSSLSSGQTEPGLMVSVDISNWKTTFPRRQYIAEIDLSDAIPGKDYWTVNRGFGHEIWVQNLDAVKVKGVYPYQKGKRMSDTYFKTLPQSEEELREVFNASR